MKKSDIIKQDIIDACATYYMVKKAEEVKSDKINYAGRVYDYHEIQNLVESALDFNLTFGGYIDKFEKRLSEYLDVKYSLFVNSGSSANLLAFMALTSQSLGEERIKRGDEVITLACSFPTTVAPILQYGAIPVFVDIEIDTLNIDKSQLKFALSDKTKAIIVANTLGNSINIEVIRKFCDDNGLWLILDCCDSLGATYNGRSLESYGHISTSSFYPAHHITCGQGGAVHTDINILKVIMQSIRDWGRGCTCKSASDNKCGNRFTGQYGKLPLGFDHKYIYEELGMNLQGTEMQASIGVAQLEKLPEFIRIRNSNWNKLYNVLKQYDDLFIFQQAEKNSEPSWFGFTLTLTEACKFNRNEIVQYLENKGIQTRLLFSGNIIKQPFMEYFRQSWDYVTPCILKNTDYVMSNTFFIGVYPGLTEDNISYMINTIKEFINEKA